MFRKLLFVLLMSLPVLLLAQANRIDLVRPEAPGLAAYGDLNIGVRTIEVTDPGRIDVLNTPRGGEPVYYSRTLTLEIWYPANLAAEQLPGGEYRTTTRNTEIIATLRGKAVRDAAPATDAGPYPLLIISHGYPGNRFLLSHAAENLASKGYVVASIDHPESTYQDQQPVTSTFYHRALDQRQVIAALAELTTKPDQFLGGLVDADNTGIIGYSMGGYGLVNNLGAGYSEAIVSSFIAPPNKLLQQQSSGNPQFRDNLDSRIKAGVAVAPWGMQQGFWQASDLAGITVPTLYVAGDKDTVAGYEKGTRAIFENATNSDRYLLTYKNASHNAGAPIPLPVELQDSEDTTGASHYLDPVWDTVTMNNIMDHFMTAFFDYYLKGKDASLSYLQLVPDGADAVYSMRNGEATATHNYWKGFSAGTAVGLRLEHLQPGQ
jgi:predicted dienelactone hydrolase